MCFRSHSLEPAAFSTSVMPISMCLVLFLFNFLFNDQKNLIDVGLTGALNVERSHFMIFCFAIPVTLTNRRDRGGSGHTA